mmetsp:Transcript_16004/g.28888  ORF Transcript_16004/g.28888 Transcript_16004/m.28888 type:complete len:392 (-) Transcript_16004:954-2129(-)
MDLLASLHLDSELPEQQTRISHLADALAADTSIRLGFNSCCVCGKRDLSVECRNCRRVKYCSPQCRQADCDVTISDEEDGAMGHSSVVCALLKLCNDDEEAEHDDSTKVDKSAIDRVQSEYESYPATLANVLLDGPCFKVMLARACHEKELVIHVIGASVDAELWGRQQDSLDMVWDAYADALQELAETNGLNVIRLCLIGPDCPAMPMNVERRIPYYRKEGRSCQLVISTSKRKYSSKLFHGGDALSKPDVVCLFNPGFTCPDYSWDDTLNSLDYGAAFIITTNTEMECIGDCQYLLEKKLLPSLPPTAAEIIGTDCDDENSEIMFGENPFSGTRVRQSGTMANDLFVKNRWLLAGVFGKPMVIENEERPMKKSKTGEHQNSKRSNTALI